LPEATTQRPILFLDVDGVISLFGFPSRTQPPGQFHWVDGIAHCISDGAGPRLCRLAEAFEMVWATGWEEKANEYLPILLNLPDDELPVLTFDGRAVFGTAHWKLEAIEEYAGQRALAWVDDSLDSSCYEWAQRRSAPTLLVPTEPDHGLEEAHVAALEGWAQEGFPVR